MAVLPLPAPHHPHIQQALQQPPQPARLTLCGIVGIVALGCLMGLSKQAPLACLPFAELEQPEQDFINAHYECESATSSLALLDQAETKAQTDLQFLQRSYREFEEARLRLQTESFEPNNFENESIDSAAEEKRKKAHNAYASQKKLLEGKAEDQKRALDQKNKQAKGQLDEKLLAAKNSLKLSCQDAQAAAKKESKEAEQRLADLQREINQCKGELQTAQNFDQAAERAQRTLHIPVGTHRATRGSHRSTKSAPTNLKDTDKLTVQIKDLELRVKKVKQDILGLKAKSDEAESSYLSTKGDLEQENDVQKARLDVKTKADKANLDRLTQQDIARLSEDFKIDLEHIELEASKQKKELRSSKKESMAKLEKDVERAQLRKPSFKEEEAIMTEGLKELNQKRLKAADQKTSACMKKERLKAPIGVNHTRLNRCNYRQR